MFKLIATLLLAFAPSAFAASTTTIQATNTEGFVSNQNLILNSNFEQGTVGWTASGGSFASTTSSPLRGSKSVTWDSSSASQTLTSTAFTIPEGLKGQAGSLSCAIQTASGTATHTIVGFDGSSNVGTPTTISSSATGGPRSTINFTFPTSGTIALRLTSVNANEPSIKIDDCVVSYSSGLFTGGGSVTSQSTGAERIERARIANSGTCTTTTQSGSWVGSLSHPGTGQCTITYATNLFSGTPSCTCTVESAGYGCAIDSISSSAVTYRATVTSTGSNSDQPVDIICMGPKGSL